MYRPDGLQIVATAELSRLRQLEYSQVYRYCTSIDGNTVLVDTGIGDTGTRTIIGYSIPVHCTVQVLALHIQLIPSTSTNRRLCEYCTSVATGT